MKRFRFRLEAVRSLRELAERSARERFGLAQRRLAEAREAHAEAVRRRLALADTLNTARAGSFRPAEQASGLFALELALRAEKEASRLVAEAVAALDRAREDWLAARRRLQVVQRLEERARLAHREAAEKAEQALLDELASVAAARLSPLS